MKVTIKRGKEWHAAIYVSYAQQIIKRPTWQIKAAVIMHKKLDGWTIKEVKD